MKKGKNDGYGISLRIGSGTSVCLVQGVIDKDRILIAFKRPISENDVKNGRLISSSKKAVRGGKLSTRIVVSRRAAEALYVCLDDFLFPRRRKQSK